MSYIRRSHFTRMAAVAASAILLLGGSALGQTAPVFDDAPSIEQLRSIMIPESRPGASRSIVMHEPTGAAPSAVQRVSTQEQAPAPPPAAKVQNSARPVAHAADSGTEPQPEGRAVAFHVNFAFNSATVPESAYEMIDVVAQLMQESPEIKVRIEGHTDAVGTVAYNVSLSERRALSVGEYLVKKGIDPSRLQLVGKGMAEPLTRNKYDAANRRVQFVRIA